MIACEWELLPKPTFPRLFTSLPSWAELVSAVDRIAVRLQTWQVLDQLGQTGPTNPSLGSNKSGVTDGSPDFKPFTQQDDWLRAGVGQSAFRSRSTTGVSLNMTHKLIWLLDTVEFYFGFKCNTEFLLESDPTEASTEALGLKRERPAYMFIYILYMSVFHHVIETQTSLRHWIQNWCINVIYVSGGCLLPVQCCQQQLEWCCAKTWWSISQQRWRVLDSERRISNRINLICFTCHIDLLWTRDVND